MFVAQIRKLRASIADLSEENARDMEEVHRRGLKGGINLVRGLREEIRDIDFQIGEFRTLKAEFRTKISIIRARIHTERNCIDRAPVEDSSVSSHIESAVKQVPMSCIVSEKPSHTEHGSTIGESNQVTSLDITEHSDHELDIHNGHHQDSSATKRSTISYETSIKRIDPRSREKQLTPSEKIAAGQSTAIAVIRPGNRGFFTVDLWQVILRIMGFDRAADQRGFQVASTQPNVMIV